MARNNEKGKRFDFLVGRVDESLKAGYYIEAMAITYALLEERSYTLLDRLNIPYDSEKDKLYKCINMIKKAITSRNLSVTPKKGTVDDLLDYLSSKMITSELLKNIQVWRKDRNDVIHDLAKQTIDYSSLKQTAENGREYFALYSAAIMSIKKKL